LIDKNKEAFSFDISSHPLFDCKLRYTRVIEALENILIKNNYLIKEIGKYDKSGGWLKTKK